MVIGTVDLERVIRVPVVIIDLDVLHLPATLEGRVHREEALVGSVHRRVDVEVGRKGDLDIILQLGIVTKVLHQFFLSVDGELGHTVFTVQQLEKVAEDLGAITTVDFFDDEINRRVGMFLRRYVCVGENLRHELVVQHAILLHRLIAPDKSSVVIVRVERGAEHIGCSVIELDGLLSLQSFGKFFDLMRLASAWTAIVDCLYCGAIILCRFTVGTGIKEEEKCLLVLSIGYCFHNLFVIYC